MQGKIQQHIQQFMADHKRRRVWKRATAVLSAVVLLSTFLSLRNFAIAVTEENAHEAMITEAVQAALAEAAAADGDLTPDIVNEFTPEAVDTTNPEAVDTTNPEAVDTTNPEAVDTTNTDLPLEGNADTGDGSAVSGSIDTENRSPVSDETAPAPVDIVDDPVALADAPAAVEEDTPALMMRAAPMDTALRAAPAQITSAVPTGLYITQNGNPVGTVYDDSLVEVEISWRVENSSEIDVAGDYITMTLPAQLNFPAGDGSYQLAQATTGFLGRTWPAGTSLADYTISGNTLKLTFTEAGVDLNAAGKLMTPALMGALQWSAMQFSGVSIRQTGVFTPEFTINGSSVRNNRALTVLANQAELLTGAQITSLTLPYAETWNPYNNSYYPSYARKSVYAGTPFVLNLEWSWKNLTQTISDGDYFEFRLPSQLLYDTYTGRSMDAGGNLSETRIYQDNSGRWVMRVTFLDVVDHYNTSAGNQDITAYAPPSLISGYNDYVSLTLQADVSGSYNSGKSVNIYVRQNGGGGGSTTGKWYVQEKQLTYPDGRPSDKIQIYDFRCYEYDYQVQESGTEMSPALFVVADQMNKPNLTPYPFNDPTFTYRDDGRWGYDRYGNRVKVYTELENRNMVTDYVPGASNYIDTYCADRANTNEPRNGYDRITLNWGDYYGNLSTTQVKKLHTLLSVSFPYVSLDRMASKIGVGTITDEGAAVSAVQTAIWNIIHNKSWSVTGNRAYSANTVLNALQRYVNNNYSYRPSTGTGSSAGYSFAQGPQITFNASSATVTGRLSGSSFSNLTGTFTTESGRSTTFTVDRNGNFSARLDGISAGDKFKVTIKWSTAGDTVLYYFDGKYDNYCQDMIAAEVEEQADELCWEYQDQLRDIKVIKRWLDQNGKIISGWPQGKELTVTLYRQITGGLPEVVPATAQISNPVTLNSSRQTYTWKNLPVRDNSGNVYHYSAVETGIPSGFDYVGVETSAEGETLVFTAINAERQPEKTKFQVVKDWINPQTGTVRVKSHILLLKTNAADTARQQLYVKVKDRVFSQGGDIVYGEDYDTTQRNGYVLAAWTLSDDNGWKATFEGLPKYEADGKTLARYVIFEDYFVIRRNGREITYHVNPDGTTYYEDENGQRKQGEFNVGVVQPVMGDVDTGRIPSCVVENTEDDAETEVTVVKKWAGVPDGKTDGYKVTVQLFRQNKGTMNHGNGTKTAVRIKNRVNMGGTNGQPLVVTGDYTATKNASAADGDIVSADLTKQANNWTVTFKGLPKYEEDGSLIQYLVRETAIYDADGDVLYLAPNDSTAGNAQDEGLFTITYAPETTGYPYGDGYYYSPADMESEHPTVTVTNAGKDSSLVVIKEWKDASGNDLKDNLPEYIKVRLSLIREKDGTEIPENMWNMYVQGGATNRERFLNAQNNWRQTWTVYPAKGIRYEITEVEVPAGWKNDNPTVTAVKVNGIWVVRLLNILENTKVKVIKYDAKPPWSGLEGAEFDLYESDIRGVSAQEHWTKLNKAPLVTNQNGQVWLEELKLNTTYVLIETKPPKGFKRPVNKVIYFEVILKNGRHELSFFNHETDDNGGWDYYQYDPTTMAISIKNDRVVYTLPETGGLGTNRYITGGICLMAFASLFYITQPMWADEKRRRRASK